VSLTVQAPLTGVASQFSARRQLGAVHGSSSVRLAMHQHTFVYMYQIVLNVSVMN